MCSQQPHHAGLNVFEPFSDFDYLLTDNARLNATLSTFKTATVIYSTIDSDGYGKCPSF